MTGLRLLLALVVIAQVNAALLLALLLADALRATRKGSR